MKVLDFVTQDRAATHMFRKFRTMRTSRPTQLIGRLSLASDWSEIGKNWRSIDEAADDGAASSRSSSAENDPEAQNWPEDRSPHAQEGALADTERWSDGEEVRETSL